MSIPTEEEEVFFQAKAQIALSVRALEYLNGFQYLMPSGYGYPCPYLTEHSTNRYVRCHADAIYVQRGGRNALSMDDFTTVLAQQEWRDKNPYAKQINIGFLIIAAIMFIIGLALNVNGWPGLALFSGMILVIAKGVWGLVNLDKNHEFDHIRLFTLDEYVALAKKCESANRIQSLLSHATNEFLKIYAIQVPTHYDTIKAGMPT